MKAVAITFSLPIGLAVCMLAMSMPSNTQGQNLFESDFGSGNINEFTPSGAQSTFASALSPSFVAIQVPEPSACCLLGLGIVALLGSRQLRRR
ncbi:MAG TPA: PEP-CTERM sorting domain-containing protein [Verrucomicrobiae bacterium]|nr:PEP-CTERM sorting domain-containing protein [Verrucomicrobiae bacterium]